MRIDAHQHFWQFDPVRDSWITEDMKSIRRHFFPEDLVSELSSAHFDGCIAVQADQSEQETNFLIKLAAENSFIKGVVGWVDLTAKQVHERLQDFSRHKIIKG